MFAGTSHVGGIHHFCLPLTDKFIKHLLLLLSKLLLPLRL